MVRPLHGLERHTTIGSRAVVREGRHLTVLMGGDIMDDTDRVDCEILPEQYKLDLKLRLSLEKSRGRIVGPNPKLRGSADAMTWAIIAACLLLGACRGDRAQDIDACWSEGTRSHPSEPVDAPSVLATIPMCMRGKGYDTQVASEFCPVSNQSSTVLNPDCYRPRGLASRTLYTAEFLLRHLRP
jgi:hypothetical protein